MNKNVRKISFSPPDISELEIEEVVAALKSGWVTTGPMKRWSRSRRTTPKTRAAPIMGAA